MTRHEIREELFRLLYVLECHDGEGEEEKDRQTELFISGAMALPDTDDDDGDDGTDENGDIDVAAILKDSESDAPLMDEAAAEEIRERIAALREKIPEIDALLSERSEGWAIDRIGRVELAILRLAIFEIRFEQLTAGIAINEAVELAKAYGGERSGSFVNGVLAKVIN